MANLLDEVTGPVNDNGRDVRVIDRQLPVEIGFGSTLFEIALWTVIPCLVLLYVFLLAIHLKSFVVRGARLCHRHTAGCDIHFYENIRT